MHLKTAPSAKLVNLETKLDSAHGDDWRNGCINLLEHRVHSVGRNSISSGEKRHLHSIGLHQIHAELELHLMERVKSMERTKEEWINLSKGAVCGLERAEDMQEFTSKGGVKEIGGGEGSATILRHERQR